MGNPIEIPLHGFKPSDRILQKEDPLDREIFLLKAQGFTNRRIAETLEVSEQKVHYTVRQPWFMKNMVKFLHAKGEPAVERLLEIASQDAINVAYDEMNNPENSANLRVQAAFKFIEAARGKKIVVEESTPDLKKLQEEEAQLREQLAGLRMTKDLAGSN